MLGLQRDNPWIEDYLADFNLTTTRGCVTLMLSDHRDTLAAHVVVSLRNCDSFSTIVISNYIVTGESLIVTSVYSALLRKRVPVAVSVSLTDNTGSFHQHFTKFISLRMDALGSSGTDIQTWRHRFHQDGEGPKAAQAYTAEYLRLHKQRAPLEMKYEAPDMRSIALIDLPNIADTDSFNIAGLQNVKSNTDTGVIHVEQRFLDGFVEDAGSVLRQFDEELTKCYAATGEEQDDAHQQNDIIDRNNKSNKTGENPPGMINSASSASRLDLPLRPPPPLTAEEKQKDRRLRGCASKIIQLGLERPEIDEFLATADLRLLKGGISFRSPEGDRLIKSGLVSVQSDSIEGMARGGHPVLCTYKFCPVDNTRWKFVFKEDNPQQTNNCDCGVFAIKCIEYLVQGKKHYRLRKDV